MIIFEPTTWLIIAAVVALGIAIERLHDRRDRRVREALARRQMAAPRMEEQ